MCIARKVNIKLGCWYITN